jgi:transposase InsO family protein
MWLSTDRTTWVADVIYVAVILEAGSRRGVGYTISRSLDVRLNLTALDAAIEGRKPSPGCAHHSDLGLVGSMVGTCRAIFEKCSSVN